MSAVLLKCRILDLGSEILPFKIPTNDVESWFLFLKKNEAFPFTTLTFFTDIMHLWSQSRKWGQHVCFCVQNLMWGLAMYVPEW